MNANCQSCVHQYPDGFRVYWDEEGESVCGFCGFGEIMHLRVHGILGPHITRASGVYRTVTIVNPVRCSSCGKTKSTALFPCGDESGGLFAHATNNIEIELRK